MDSRNGAIDDYGSSRSQVTISYSALPFHMVAGDVAKLLPGHMEPGYGKPLLDWDYYLSASHAGQCFAVTAYNEAELVGYAVFFITNNANHRNRIEATNSGLFVKPEYRGRASQQLLLKATEHCRALGVHEVSFMLADERVGKLLARQGYKPTHTLWSLRNE